MTDIQLILNRLDRIEELITGGSVMLKVPQAAKKLGIAPARLRQLCKKGQITCRLVAEKSKRPQYLINVIQASREIMAVQPSVKSRCKINLS